MSARVIIRKYTGKDGDFGTEVSSIGIKRVDTCVPSVYMAKDSGGNTVPADDASEARMYSIYTPDDPNCTNYSMESVFKICLVKAPDVQLSNIRLYPVGEPPRPGSKMPTLYIGNSVSYSQPTNAKSLVAVNDIWSYNREHPFYLTVGGTYGQRPDTQLGKMDYNVTYKDCGYGNVVYLDNERQLIVPVAQRAPESEEDEITLSFHDRSFEAKRRRELLTTKGVEDMLKAFGNVVDIMFIDHKTHLPTKIPQDYIQYRADEEGVVMDLLVRQKTVDAEGNTVYVDLRDYYPEGLIYQLPMTQTDPNFNTGYGIVWVDLYPHPNKETYDKLVYMAQPNIWAKADWLGKPSNEPCADFSHNYVEVGAGESRGNDHPYDVKDKMPYDKPVQVHQVSVQQDPSGHFVYYIDGLRQPILSFDTRCLYHFYNKDGDRFPLRFVGNPHTPIASNIDDVVTDGVVILNGHTNREEIMVNPEEVLKAGKCIRNYQCVCEPALGNAVFNVPMFLCGQYNMCRVNGGIYNPQMAGETDYVYLQLAVRGDSEPGYAVPDIAIEYDEN